MQSFVDVTVFLASSIEELARERNIFGDFIRESNEILKPMGVNVRLIKCEDLDDIVNGDKQKILDEAIRKSDYFIVLFKNKYGDVTIHEYDIASEAYDANAKPCIIPYFYSEDKYKIDFDNMDEALKILVKKYENINHYYRVFREIETVELRFFTQLIRDLRNIHNINYDTISIGTQMHLDKDKLCEELIIAGDKTYIDFAVNILSEMYKISERTCGRLVSYRNQVFPDTFIIASNEVRKFDIDSFEFEFFKFCTFNNVKPRHLNLRDYEIQRKKYLNRLKEIKIDLYGYMCDKLNLNSNGEIVSVDFLPGTYSQNLISTLTLREEFENLFKSMPESPKSIITDGNSWRKKLHTIIGDFTIENLFSGIGRYNQMGIQLIILFKNNHFERKYRKYRNSYWTPVIERKNNVYEQPGFYQFAPCGKFQIFENPETASNINVQKDMFDLLSNIMFIIARELFNDSVDQKNFGQSELDIPVRDKINYHKALNNKHCIEILDLIEQKKANFEFLGLSSSYLALKSDMVFLLKIDDDDYYSRNIDDICFSYETKSLSVVPIAILNDESYLDNPCLAEELAPCLELLRRSSYADEIFSV